MADINLGAEKAQLSREANRRDATRAKQQKTTLNSITPATGELLKDFIARRVGIGLGSVPPAMALRNAVTPMADFELEAITKVAALTPIPRPTGTGLGAPPTPRTALDDDRDILDTIASGIKTAGRGIAKAIDFVTPEDAEDLIGNTKALLLGGPDSSGDDRGYEGLIPSIVNPLTRTAHTVGNVFVDAADAVTDLTRSVLPGAGGESASEVLKRGFDPTTVDDYLHHIVTTPAGDNLAADMGLERNSLSFKVVASSTNFFVDNVALAPLAAAGRASKLASRLPSGSVLVRDIPSDLGLLRSRAITDTLTQHLFDRSSLLPEDLIAQRAQPLVARLSELAPSGPGAIQGVFPDIPTALAKEMAADPTRVADVLAAGLRGDLLPVTRSQMEARLADIATDIERLRTTTTPPTIGFATPAPSRLIRELEDEAAKLHDILDGRVITRDTRTLLHELPDPTLRTDFRLLARRTPASSKLATAARVLDDADWHRHVARPLPVPNLPTWDKDTGAAQVRAWGELFRLSSREIDDLVTEYIDTVPGETMDFATRLLQRGESNLPPSIARRLTQMKSETVARPYALNDEAESIPWKSRSRDGILSPQPIHTGQLADEIPMPDPRLYIEARQWGPRYAEWAREQAAKTTSLTAQGLLQTSRGVARAATAIRRAEETFVTQFWIPSVLARLGWTVKVVGIDEHARLASMDVPGLWSHPFEFIHDRIASSKLRHADNLLAEGRTTDALELQRKWSNPVAGLIDSTPTEALTHFGRDMIGATRRPDLIVRRQGYGYGPSWQDELVQLHNGREVQYLAAHGRADTIRWLQSHPAGQDALRRMKPVLAKIERQPGTKGATVEDFVDTLDAHLTRIAPTPQLRSAIATGRYQIPDGPRVWIGDGRLGKHLQDATDGPNAVRGSTSFFTRHDPNSFRNFQRNLMTWLGSNPSNVSRSQVYAHLYDREVTSLVSRGVPQQLAESAARSRVIHVTNELLYDLTQRTSFDQVHKALLPFFGAYREVLAAWGRRIPQSLGGDLGHIVLAGKLGALQGLAEDLGIYRDLTDAQGRPLGPGVNLFNRDFPIRNLLFISSAPAPGPARQAMLKTIAKDVPAIRKFEEKMGWYADASISLGPAWLNRAWWSAFQSPPPWEIAMGSARHQQAQWDLGLNKALKNHSAEIVAISKLPAGQQSDALAVVLASARSDARTDYLARALRGFILPVQPLSLASVEDKAIRDALDSLDEGAKADFYRDLQVNNPVAYLRLASTTFLTSSAAKDERGIEAFWRQIDDGNRKVMDPDAFAKYLLGRARYSAIRHDYAAAIARAGTNARDLALNYHLVRAAAVDRDNAIDALIYESEDPDSAVNGWSKAYNDVIRIYRDDQTYAEFKLRQTARAVRETLDLLPEDMLTQVDVAAVKGFTAIIYESLGDVFDSTPPSGPEGTLARWFDKVYGPYQTNLAGLYAKRDAALANGTDPAVVYDQIRRYRNDQASVTIDGQKMPSPEEFSFGAKTPAEQRTQRVKWALNNPLWLTNFQRKELGLESTSATTSFLDLANEVRLGLDSALATASSTDRSRANDLFSDWVSGEASNRGFDFDLSSPYQRLTDYKLVRGTGWTRMVQVADGFNAALAAADRKRPNAEQQALFNNFVKSKMSTDTQLAATMRSLWKASHLAEKPFYDQFIPFVFFSR